MGKVVDDVKPIISITGAEDLNRNAAVTVSRKITVQDTTAPKITRKGGNVKIEAGFKYADAGASAWDNLNRNLNTKIVKTITFKGKTVSKVDTSKTGVYTITYNVKDASGNKAV